MVVMALGGRAAEELVFNSVTTGAANDIEQATAYVRNMITMYGMSDEFGLMALETVENQYLDGTASLTCSEQTATGVDEEVVAILKESYEEALSLLRENSDIMDKLAEFLIEKETITGKEFMEIFRKEKGLPEPEEKKEEPKREEAPRHSFDASIFDNEVKILADTEPVETEEPVEETSEEPSQEPKEEPSQEPDDRPVGLFSNRKLDE